MNYRLLNCRLLLSEKPSELFAIDIASNRIQNISINDEVLSHPPVKTIDMDGDYLAPGLFDIQVNGGGGVLFNDAPSIDALRRISDIHIARGTTSFLPTLISDDFDVIKKGIQAVELAIEEGVAGVRGIHIEGPCLGIENAGIHDKQKFRPLDDEGIELFGSLKGGATLVTLAPEAASPDAISALCERGVTVALGHSNATFDEAEAALDAGATGFTHLYNAMSAMTSRAPGMVGAALLADDAYASLIVDTHHVSKQVLRVALKMKTSDKLMLISDAMPVVGTNADRFQLNGQQITSYNGRLINDHGQLAGSAISLWDAVQMAPNELGVTLSAAVSMATQIPARFLNLENEIGTLNIGSKADIIRISPKGDLVGVCVSGHWRQ